MTAGERDKVLSTIRKLLKLAENEAATPAEASTAAEKAQALLIKYALSRGDVGELNEQPEKYVVHTFTYCTVGIQYVARDMVLVLAAEAAMCRCVNTTSKHRKVPATAALIGTETNVQVAEYLYWYISNELLRLAGVSLPNHLRRANIEYKQRAWKRDFVSAAISQLRKRLLQPLTEAMALPESRAVLVLDKQLVDELTARSFGKLKGGRSVKLHGHNDALAKGREAGANLPLHKGVTSGGVREQQKQLTSGSRS